MRNRDGRLREKINYVGKRLNYVKKRLREKLNYVENRLREKRDCVKKKQNNVDGLWLYKSFCYFQISCWTCQCGS